MTKESQDGAWPLPKFYFNVKFGSYGINASFQEVSGLDTETQIIEYRHDNSKEFSTVKMPGIIKGSNVTLKKGVFINDDNFKKWHDEVRMNAIKRETVIIQLLDERAKPTMTWTLINAWPTKITGPDMKSNAKEVEIETIELAYEELNIAN